MSQSPTSALSSPFQWATNGAGYDFTMKVGSPGVTHGFNLPSGNYSMFLGPTAAGVLPAEAITAIVGLLNTYYAGSPTFSSSMDPSTGRWTLSASSGVFTYTAVNALFDATFGVLVGSASSTSATSTYPPRYLLLFSSLVGQDWQQQTPLAGQTAEDGTVYAISSGTTRYTDTLDLSYIPVDPTAQAQAGTACSPWFSADAYLPLSGALLNVAAQPWDVSDHLQASLGQTQALARGNWPAVCASAAAYYDLVTIPADEVSAPKVKMQFTAWTRWRRWTTKITRLASQPVGNRE